MPLPPEAALADVLADGARRESGFASALGAWLRVAGGEFLAIVRGDGDRSRTQRDAIVAFGVRVASAGLLYLSQIVLARWIGGYDYGIYVFIWTWVLVLGGLAPLGVNVLMMRLLPVYRETGELDLHRGLIRGGMLFGLAAGTLVALAGALGLWQFGEHLATPYLLPAYLALVCIPLYALTDVQDGIGRGEAWMGLALVPPYVLRPLLVLVTMAAANLAGLPMTAATAAGAAIVATWLSGLVQSVLILIQMRREIPPGPRRYSFGPWLKMSLPLVVMTACELMLQNTDILVISRYMTPVDVGIYFAAAKTMSLILFVHFAVGSAVAKRYSELNARGDKEGLKAFVKDAVNWTFWPSLAGAVLILAVGKPLLSLFGPGFEDGYIVMFILVVGFLFRASMGPVEFLLNMLGEQTLCAAVLVVTALLNVALNFALVPAFGLIGAATATSISLVTAALMNTMVAKSRLEIDNAIWQNLPRLGAAPAPGLDDKRPE